MKEIKISTAISIINVINFSGPSGSVTPIRLVFRIVYRSGRC